MLGDDGRHVPDDCFELPCSARDMLPEEPIAVAWMEAFASPLPEETFEARCPRFRLGRLSVVISAPSAKARKKSELLAL